MIFLNDEQVEARLNSPDNLARNPKAIISEEVLITPENNGGRRPGDTNVPAFIRELAGTFANLEPSKAVAEIFNLSKSQVDQYKVGCVTPGRPDPALTNAINNNLGRAHELAIEKMVASLEAISQTDISNARVRDKASIARDLASVAEKLAPKEIEKKGDFQLIVYAPTLKTESHYEVKEVITKVAQGAKITDQG